MYWQKFYILFTATRPSSSRTHFYWETAMRKFNFRIGTKLGIAAGLGVLLVGGMLINQQVGNALIEKYALYTNLNFIYKGMGQEALIATERAYHATTKIERAASAEQLNQANAELQSSIAEALKQIVTLHERVLRAQLKTIYWDAKTALERYLAAGNDLSARDLQMRTSQWLLGKTLDGFCPIGPYLVTRDEVADPQQLELRTWVNGELRQNSSTADMIFSVAEIVSYASQYMTLDPGDVIITGTPEGVILGMPEPRVWLKPGDEVTVEVQGLGRLVTPLVA